MQFESHTSDCKSDSCKAETQARANIAKANGESQAIRIINEQLHQNPHIYKKKQI